ncbi:hypothetical protein ACHHYP_01313 [Achlya hypogyna]|uniref:M96 mating-specific protein family n=1 Tax=Achlya hypogyna TaxID=1202772 RepID=A0A1V9Z8W1_ACHHY|nr:hypothetical protein ACHHYP_01313 [Achlya hypogyna]
MDDRAMELDAGFIADDLDLLFLPLDDETPEKPRPKRVRKRHADEIKFLEKTVAELTAQLATLEEKKLEVVPLSTWENIARRQAQEAQVAIQKNQRLREALEEQLALAHGLQKIFTKKTKYTMESLCEDGGAPERLSMDPIARAASVRAMLDAEHAKLESAFIQHGLVDVVPPFRRVCVEDEEACSHIMLTFSRAEIVPVAMPDFAAWMWQFLCFDAPIITPRFTMKRLEILDDDLIYFQFHTTCPEMPDLRTNYGVTKYEDGNKVTFVLRAIGLDSVSSAQEWATGDSTEWVTLEPMGDGSTLVRMALYIQFPYKRQQNILRVQSPLSGSPSSDSDEDAALSQLILDLFTKNQEVLDSLTFEMLVKSTLSNPDVGVIS